MDRIDAIGETQAWLAAFGDQQATPGLVLNGVPMQWPPGVAQDSGCQVVFDGVLHNSHELRLLLADSPSHDAGDADDASLLLSAYRRWGEGAWTRSRGNYALLVWDRAKAQLWCVRDALGVHPLFYAQAGPTLLLSPSIETLLAHPGVSRELNRHGMVEHLASCWFNGDETYFRQVRRVPPGHLLRIDATGRQVLRHWNLELAADESEWIPDAEAQISFDALLEQAVARCLRLGASSLSFSGGLDSSSVARVATDIRKRQGEDPIKAFSLVFPTPEVDEALVQRGVAMRLGLPHMQWSQEQVVGARGALGAALDLSRTLPAPLAHFSRPAMLRIGLEAQRSGCRFMLTGEGADEWLGVQHSHAADLLRAFDLKGLYHLWSVFSRSYSFTKGAELRRTLWLFGLRQLLRNAVRGRAILAPALAWRQRLAGARQASALPWLAPDPGLRAQFAGRIEQQLADEKVLLPAHSFRRNEMRKGIETPRKWMTMEESFVTSRRNGLCMQHPFWDQDLIELLVRVHPRVLLRGGLSKALLRDSLVRRFPSLGFERQRKSSLAGVFLSVMAAEADTARRSLGRMRVLGELGVVDPDRVDTFLDNPAAGGPQWWVAAWHVLNLETWARSRQGSVFGQS